MGYGKSVEKVHNRQTHPQRLVPSPSFSFFPCIALPNAAAAPAVAVAIPPRITTAPSAQALEGVADEEPADQVDGLGALGFEVCWVG
jgi:hypothetical protein